MAVRVFWFQRGFGAGACRVESPATNILIKRNRLSCRAVRSWVGSDGGGGTQVGHERRPYVDSTGGDS